ncbi:MAG: heavy metal-binding domain-containing protein [Bryobacteraceae bacterium]
MTRRIFVWMMGAIPSVLRPEQTAGPSDDNRDWVCPMDPDYRSANPGKCPKCGMTLVLGIPDRIEFHMKVGHTPRVLKPGHEATLDLRFFDPRTHQPATRFEIVHEKLIHFFLVSESLEFFAHVHPERTSDQTFRQRLRLPEGGMYRLLADFYPAGSVPQMALSTLYVTGHCKPPHLAASLSPQTAKNLTVTLRVEPEHTLAGVETKLHMALNPNENLEQYLGAWGHMLTVSADLIEVIHTHPFLRNPDGSVQFNLVFPRPGLYRIWTQFQRKGVVNTVIFTIPVSPL